MQEGRQGHAGRAGLQDGPRAEPPQSRPRQWRQTESKLQTPAAPSNPPDMPNMRIHLVLAVLTSAGRVGGLVVLYGHLDGAMSRFDLNITSDGAISVYLFQSALCTVL
jgi:hypothetical protein